jgi:hypothetical protein
MCDHETTGNKYMHFNFDELLQEGKGAAENVIQNGREVKAVLNNLQNSLSQFLEIPIKFQESIEYVQDDPDLISKGGLNFKAEETGFKVVHIVSEQVKCSKEVFKLKHSQTIYPITVVEDKNYSVADDQSEFASVIGKIVSNSQFHLQLHSFKSLVEEKLKDKPWGHL